MYIDISCMAAQERNRKIAIAISNLEKSILNWTFEYPLRCKFKRTDSRKKLILKKLHLRDIIIQKLKRLFIILFKKTHNLIPWRHFSLFPFRKYLRRKHSHGYHKILFTARLLLFRLGEWYSVVTARHEERYLLASTFPFITAFSTSSRSYETICNFVQRYSGSHFYIYDPRIYPGSRRWGRRIER